MCIWYSTVSAGPFSAGFFGALTAEAVKEWQKNVGLPETGAFDGQCRLQYLQQQVRSPLASWGIQACIHLSDRRIHGFSPKVFLVSVTSILVMLGQHSCPGMLEWPAHATMHLLRPPISLLLPLSLLQLPGKAQPVSAALTTCVDMVLHDAMTTASQALHSSSAADSLLAVFLLRHEEWLTCHGMP